MCGPFLSMVFPAHIYCSLVSPPNPAMIVPLKLFFDKSLRGTVCMRVVWRISCWLERAVHKVVSLLSPLSCDGIVPLSLFSASVSILREG